MDPAAELARELRAARVEAGLSLKELEPLTASSDSSLSRYLSGASVPPWSVVEALCTAARRDPQTLVPLWEAAQRGRFERRFRGRDGVETDQDTGKETLEPGGGAAAPAGPRSRRLNSRILVMAGVAVGVVAIAIAVAVALSPEGGKPPQPAMARLCPWHYVVTDGDPAPVLIADSWGPNRKHIGIYEPGQVFYVADPPAVSHGMLKTVDGWVTDGAWIQRYSDACVTVPRASATGPS